MASTTTRLSHRGSRERFATSYLASSRRALRYFLAVLAATFNARSVSGSYGVSKIPRSVSTASTRSPASRRSRSAISFGNVALTDPPACRSVTSLVMGFLGEGRIHSSIFVLLDDGLIARPQSMAAGCPQPRRSPVKMSLEMGFSVAGEHVGTLVQQFRELLKL